MSNIPPSSSQPVGWFGRNRRILLIGGPVLALLVALAGYMLTGRYVSTDDAYVQSARVDISTEVSGRIAEIDVHDNQLVRRGQVLFRLDTPRFRIAVADARAQLSAAQFNERVAEQFGKIGEGLPRHPNRDSASLVAS